MLICLLTKLSIKKNILSNSYNNKINIYKYAIKKNMQCRLNIRNEIILKGNIKEKTKWLKEITEHFINCASQMLSFVYLVSVATMWLSIKRKTRRGRWLRDLHQGRRNINWIGRNWHAFPPAQLHFILHYVATCQIVLR